MKGFWDWLKAPIKGKAGIPKIIIFIGVILGVIYVILAVKDAVK